MPTASAATGISAPTVLAQVHTMRTVRPTQVARSPVTPQSSARPNAIPPSKRPSKIPVDISLSTMRRASRVRTSPSASARITVDTVCEPAFPPVPMSNGMKNDSATTLDSASSKWRSTVPVAVSATNSSTSQVMRLLRTQRHSGA